ncbi:MAG: hypothetical protein P8J89_08445 [Phycisphaerales bacterium]|nr:hypothetical protein [Phycisphaerales bacterium]
MHSGSILGKTMSLCCSLLICVAIASTTSANPQKMVIDEHVNPRWINDDQLEFSRTEDGNTKRFRIDRQTGEITNASAEAEGTDRLPGRPVSESSSRGGDVPIIFKNDTKQTIRLMWVDGSGTEVPYGQL